MDIIPAIDLIDGKCVRLIQGDYNKKTIYNDDALLVASDFIKSGAKLIHVVDLDGAKAGKITNIEVIKKLVSNNIPIEVGGGVRTFDDIDLLLNIGVKRVILGSVAVLNPEFLEEAITKYGENKIVLGLDCKNGYVSIKGWLQDSKLKDIEMLNLFKAFGGKYVIYTDISKDGMMSGVNIESIKKLIPSKLNIIASGGVSSIEEVIKCKNAGCSGAIIGKAYYTGKINISEAIKNAN